LALLHSNFFRGLDHSLLEQSSKSILNDPSAWEDKLIGEGADCCAYLTLQRQYVVTVPKPEFYQRRLVAEWLRRLQELTTLGQVPLLPPLKIIQLDEFIVVVSPYGEHESAAVASHWQPLTDWIARTERYLRRHGLQIDDTLQIRVRSGIPFIVDFSDLRLLEGA
jgi:hypothetical protein